MYNICKDEWVPNLMYQPRNRTFTFDSQLKEVGDLMCDFLS